MWFVSESRKRIGRNTEFCEAEIIIRDFQSPLDSSENGIFFNLESQIIFFFFSGGAKTVAKGLRTLKIQRCIFITLAG